MCVFVCFFAYFVLFLLVCFGFVLVVVVCGGGGGSLGKTHCCQENNTPTTARIKDFQQKNCRRGVCFYLIGKTHRLRVLL